MKAMSSNVSHVQRFFSQNVTCKITNVGPMVRDFPANGNRTDVQRRADLDRVSKYMLLDAHLSLFLEELYVVMQ